MTEPGRPQVGRVLGHDTGHEPVVGEHRRRRSLSDEHAAFLHEGLERPQAVAAETAAPVIGRVGRRPDVRGEIGLLVRLRRSTRGHVAAVDLHGPGRVDDDVELRAQVALPNEVVGEVGVGDLEPVEHHPDPALVLRARPRVEVADARHVEVVRRDVRRGVGRPRRQPEFPDLRIERRAVGVRDDERAGRRSGVRPDRTPARRPTSSPPAFANRNVARLPSVVWSMTSVPPLPAMVPTPLKSAVASAIGFSKMLLSSIVCTCRLRSSVNDQPVSSYGRGFCSGNHCTPSSMLTKPPYG